jgi:hypothetical protein
MRDKMREITGTGKQSRMAAESKSEHMSIVVRTPEGDEYVLRRMGGNASAIQCSRSLSATPLPGLG